LSPNGKQGYIKKNTAAGAGEGIDYLPKKTIENDIHIRYVFSVPGTKSDKGPPERARSQ
jgi:hypothetical protein